MRAFALLALIALVSVPNACSSGGSGTSQSEIAVTQFAGTWDVTVRPRSTTCPPLGSTEFDVVTISISGSAATITVAGEAPFSLPLVNGRIVGTRAGDPSEVQDFDLGLTSTNVFVGTVTTRFAGSGGISTCTDVDDVTATRSNNNSNTLPSSFSGTWNYVETIPTNVCGVPSGSATNELVIVVNGSVATLTGQGQTFTLPVVNGRLQGENNGGTYDLGLTGNNTFSGTVTANVAFGGPECLLVVQIQGTRI